MGFVHPYLPNSADDVRAGMLEAVGAASVEDFYADVPPALRLGRDLELRCMDMVLAGGETSRLWLGAAAIAAATAPDDAARDALCGAAAP